jgi:hypothetical protein
VKAKKAIPLTDAVITQEYIDSVNQIVKSKFTLSSNMLMENYYAHVS